MPAGKLTANGSVGFENVNSREGVNILVSGDFGGGTIAVEKRVAGTVTPLLNAGTAVTYTVPDDSAYLLKPSDQVRITLTGATAPNIVWSITQ